MREEKQCALKGAIFSVYAQNLAFNHYTLTKNRNRKIILKKNRRIQHCFLNFLEICTINEHLIDINLPGFLHLILQLTYSNTFY